MNDELPFERLARHAGPADVDEAFADRLYPVLLREMGLRNRSWGPALMLAAALAATVALTGAIAMGSGVVRLPWVDRMPIPPSSVAPSQSLQPVPPTAPAALGTWAGTGNMITPTYLARAILLSDGTVLVAGGSVGTEVRSSAERFDPVSGSWTATGRMHQARAGHSATLLPNGTVLVAGGYLTSRTQPEQMLASAELYDPAAGTWTLTGDMNQARAGHTATPLPDGRVLVAGGPGNTAELFDPVTGTWAAIADMTDARAGHTATLLPDGRVLMAGGTSAELYDPITDSWTATGDLNEGYYGHTATLLANGLVLIAGGDVPRGPGARAWPHAALYDPALGTWTVTASMITPRLVFAATLLPDGRVLVTGGRENGAGNSPLIGEAELYDPATGTWTATASMRQARSGHTATLLPDGRVLVSGGDGALSISAEIYDIEFGE